MADPNIKIKMSVELEEAAEAVADFARKTRETLDNAYTTSVERAKKSLDELARKHQQVQTVIEQDKQKIEELAKKRQDAGKEAGKLIDQEIEGLKRIVAGREQERLKLEEKKVKLEEVGRLAVATTEAEKQGIKDTTNARIAEIAAIRDQQRAQAGVNNAVDEGSGGLGKYFNRFFGVATAIAAVNDLAKAFMSQRKEINATLEAMDKLQDKTLSQHDKFKPLFDEFGLFTDDQQKGAQTSLNKVAGEFRVDQKDAVTVASRLAGAAKAAGMTGVDDSPNIIAASRTDESQAAAMALAEKAMQLGTVLHEIDAGKRRATPEQRQAIVGSITNILNRLGGGQGLFTLLGSPEDLGRFVDNYGASQGKSGWLQKYGVFDPSKPSIDTYIRDANKNVDLFNEANKAMDTEPTPEESTYLPSRKGGVHPHRGLKPGLTVPSTQPTSINYHIRQYNYGYTPGSIAAPEQYPTRMG